MDNDIKLLNSKILLFLVLISIIICISLGSLYYNNMYKCINKICFI